MDLLQVGAHCSLPSCNVNDFLPITCKCKQVFCRDHISPNRHACSAVSAAYDPAQAGPDVVLEKLKRCDIEGCNKPSLFAFTTDPGRETCDKCHKAFCVDHRHIDTHACTPAAPSTTESTAPAPSSARALLEKNFGSKLGSASSSSTTKPKALPLKKKPPTDPAKLATYNKVQLMKMKHSAIPADPKDTPGSVPPGLRLIVKVMCGEAEKAVWFRNTISTGKAVDLLSSRFKITSSSPIQLFKHGAEPMFLQNDQPLADQASDGETLILQIAE